jgi:hypothetical protein
MSTEIVVSNTTEIEHVPAANVRIKHVRRFLSLSWNRRFALGSSIEIYRDARVSKRMRTSNRTFKNRST